MPLTADLPKSLIDLGGGRRLLDEQLKAVRLAGIPASVVVVTGYRAERIEELLPPYEAAGHTVASLYNPFWAVSNNLMSLWMAREHVLDDDCMITNGDNIFAPRVFRDFWRDTSDGVWLSTCPKAEFDDDDMKVSESGGIVSRVSKQIDPDQACTESPGLALVRGRRARQEFVATLDDLARVSAHESMFWLEVFNALAASGQPARSWSFASEGNWQEVDVHPDVSLVRRLLAESRIN